MPIYEYECKQGHVTLRTVPLAKAPGPKYIKCDDHRGGEGSTHYPNCAKEHVCGLRANRREVYKVGVGGDLPTRGAF